LNLGFYLDLKMQYINGKTSGNIWQLTILTGNKKRGSVKRRSNCEMTLVFITAGVI
jgi:hypothetical protein